VLAIEATVRLRGEEPRAAAMRLDTLILDTDAHTAHLVFRAGVGVHRRLHDLEWATVKTAPGGSHRTS